MTPPTNKKNKPYIIIAVIAVAIAAWFIAAHYFGPNSQHGIRQTVERLQQDSIALQSDFRPLGQYSELSDIDKAVSDIRELGDPLRFGHTSTDSTRLFGNEATARIANYNIEKCNTVLAEVLPLWRSKALFLLQSQLDPNSNKISISGNDTDTPTIELYSTQYIDEKEITKDAERYNRLFNNLGFAKATYAISPANNGIEYKFRE